MATNPPTTPIIWPPAHQALLDGMNFDESRVGSYTLPSALTLENGEAVTTAAEWREKRRPEILRLFRQHVYGTPLPPLPIIARVVEEGPAYDGLAIRRQMTVSFEGWDREIDFVIYHPREATEPVPCFLGLAFKGNEASFDDPALPLCRSWIYPYPGFESTRASDAMRGSATSRWPVHEILGRGYAVAVAYYGDIEPDYPGGHEVGVRSLFPPNPADDAPQAIGTWAWGLSRLMDALEAQPEIDSRRVILTGHSRLGKTALWAAACDERFAGVISNDSGCGGAAISRRNFGETLNILSTVRHYWFCPRCEVDSQTDATMPVDQHLLLAAIAPRPVLVGSAEDDHGADPKGEFLGALHASEVFELLGAKGLGTCERPPLNELTGDGIHYYIRPGGHDITGADWKFHLDFADRYFRKGR